MKPSLDTLTFDTVGWALYHEERGVRVLGNAAGDQLSVYFFALAPDIPAPLQDLEAIRSFYRAQIAAAGGGIVELEVVPMARVPAVRMILKLPQKPTGMTYLASITLPFRDFSFVVKVQCPELGMTGMRDAVVLAKSDVAVGPDGLPIGWFADPYEPTFRSPVLRNLADDVRWDAAFPDHPLTRARGYLAALERSMALSSALDAPRFNGPRPSAPKAWWKVW